MLWCETKELLLFLRTLVSGQCLFVNGIFFGLFQPQAAQDPHDDAGSSDDTADDGNDEENVGFFARIWRAILNFFKNLFGKKK